MIKRVLIILVILVLCLGTVACHDPMDPTALTSEVAQPPPTEANAADELSAEPTVSPDNEFYVSNYSNLTCGLNEQQLYETDTTLYYIVLNGTTGGRIFFSDKVYKDWMPLCCRPDCNHRNPQCNAWLEEGTYARMLLYGDHIYYITEDTGDMEYVTINRMKLDGSDHECIYTLEMPNKDTVFYSLRGWSWMFFNKYALVTFGGSQNYDGNFDNIKHESYSYLFDLGREPLEPEPYEGSYDKDGNLIFRFGHLIAGDGDILYSLSDNDNSEYRSVYKFNIAERTVDELCRISLSEEYLKSWLDGDKLYLCSSWGQGIILYVDVNDGSVTVLNEAAPKTKRWRYPYRNYIIGAYTSSADELKGTAVYDINGELIQEIPYSAYNTDITISYIIGDYAFGRDTSLDENALDDLPTWYLDLRDIGTDNLMWRKWEP